LRPAPHSFPTRRSSDLAAQVLKSARRREILRLALGWMLGFIDSVQLGVALSDVTTTLLTGLLASLRREDDAIEFAIIGMGRYGGDRKSTRLNSSHVKIS